MTVVVKPNAGALWAAEVNAFEPYCQLSSSLFSHCSPTNSDQPLSTYLSLYCCHIVIILSSYCHDIVIVYCLWIVFVMWFVCHRMVMVVSPLLHLAINLKTSNPTNALHLVNTKPEQLPMGDTLWYTNTGIWYWLCYYPMQWANKKSSPFLL